MAMTALVLTRSVPDVGTTAAPDAVLLARIRAGDDVALGHVYDRHVDVVYGLARRVTRDEQLARDVTQEVFTHLWELPDRVDLTRGTLRSYLAVLAHRRAVDEVRRHERRYRTESHAARPDHTEDSSTEVVDTAARSWGRERLANCLSTLPEEQRSAIELAYFDGLTYRQVAERLGVPEGTAKSRLRLALARMRSLLDEDVRTALS
jgi:RNA polymerase sigma-70 factor (ECF subfamily)